MQVRSVKVKSFHGKVAGDVKAAVMSLCLRQVDELIMSDCYLTCTGLNELIYAINQRTSPVSTRDPLSLFEMKIVQPHVAMATTRVSQYIFVQLRLQPASFMRAVTFTWATQEQI